MVDILRVLPRCGHLGVREKHSRKTHYFVEEDSDTLYLTEERLFSISSGRESTDGGLGFILTDLKKRPAFGDSKGCVG